MAVNTNQTLANSFLSGSPYGDFALRKLIVSAHRRSEEHGLSPDEKCVVDFVATPKQLRESNDKLLFAAEPVMKYLAKQLKLHHGDALLLLANAEATIVAVAGDTGFDLAPQLRDIKPGVNWSEAFKGTNALGTALTAKQTVLVNEGEHFLKRLQSFSCASVLIEGPNDEVMGALCITRPGALSTLRDEVALITFAANRINNRLFLAANKEHFVFAVHSSHECLDTPLQGLLALDKDGVVHAADKQALQLFGLPRNRVVGTRCQELLDGLMGFMRQANKPVGHVQMHERKLYYQLLHWPWPLFVPVQHVGTEINPSKPFKFKQQQKTLNEGVRRLINGFSRDLPMLLYGETGTGKRTLAENIHLAVLGAGAPFVRVNCADSSHGCLHSALFGDKESGQLGAVAKAQGGTVLLEDAHLLTKPQQANVLHWFNTQGGANQPEPFHLVVTTNQEPQVLHASGIWNDEFYTTVVALCFKLPPLRERPDLVEICEEFLAQEQGSNVILAEDLKALFLQSYWLGNVRQLRAVLRALLANLPRHATEITRQDLTDELLASIVAKPVAQETQYNLRSNELALMQEAIDQHGGNMSAAARQLGISRATLYRRLKK